MLRTKFSFRNIHVIALRAKNVESRLRSFVMFHFILNSFCQQFMTSTQRYAFSVFHLSCGLLSVVHFLLLPIFGTVPVNYIASFTQIGCVMCVCVCVSRACLYKIYSIAVQRRNFVVVTSLFFDIGSNKSWFELILQQRQRARTHKYKHKLRHISRLHRLASTLCTQIRIIAVLSCHFSRFDTVCSVFFFPPLLLFLNFAGFFFRLCYFILFAHFTNT